MAAIETATTWIFFISSTALGTNLLSVQRVDGINQYINSIKFNHRVAMYDSTFASSNASIITGSFVKKRFPFT